MPRAYPLSSCRPNLTAMTRSRAAAVPIAFRATAATTRSGRFFVLLYQHKRARRQDLRPQRHVPAGYGAGAEHQSRAATSGIRGRWCGYHFRRRRRRHHLRREGQRYPPGDRLHNFGPSADPFDGASPAAFRVRGTTSSTAAAAPTRCTATAARIRCAAAPIAISCSAMTVATICRRCRHRRNSATTVTSHSPVTRRRLSSSSSARVIGG